MKKTYKVLRPHQGDDFYNVGDEREVEEGDVKHLVQSGILKLKGSSKPANKAEKDVKNKAAPQAKNKGK